MINAYKWLRTLADGSSSSQVRKRLVEEACGIFAANSGEAYFEHVLPWLKSLRYRGDRQHFTDARPVSPEVARFMRVLVENELRRDPISGDEAGASANTLWRESRSTMWGIWKLLSEVSGKWDGTVPLIDAP
jgi:hypothetical protein